MLHCPANHTVKQLTTRDTSGSWYASGSFWTGAGVLIAVVAIVITVVLWSIGERRGLIIYSIPVSAPLLQPSWAGHGAF